MDVQLREKLPEDLARGVIRFERWRRSRPAGARIPDDLWQLALNLADRYGISRTAVALKVGYYCLKKRLSHRAAGKLTRQPTGSRELALSTRSQPGFVELPPVAGATGSSECWLEFEKPSGARLRVGLRGPALADVCQKRLSEGKFRWWPSSPEEPVAHLAAHQLHVLLSAGDPSGIQAAPQWRPVSPAA